MADAQLTEVRRLIDGLRRNPRTHPYHGRREYSDRAREVMVALAGMVEVIAGERTLEDVIWKDPKTGLSVLPTVRKKPLIHTSEILSSAPTRLLFEKLRASYDYVVVDLPPLAPVVDTRAGGHLVDGLILVVEWASTRIDVVQQSLHAAPNLQGVLIGAVVNKTDMKALKRYTNYNIDEHYGRYGITS